MNITLKALAWAETRAVDVECDSCFPKSQQRYVSCWQLEYGKVFKRIIYAHSAFICLILRLYIRSFCDNGSGSYLYEHIASSFRL